MNMIQNINDVLAADVTMSRAAAFAAIVGGVVAWEIIKTVASCIFYRVRKWRRDRLHRSPAYQAKVKAEKDAREATRAAYLKQMNDADHARFTDIAEQIKNL